MLCKNISCVLWRLLLWLCTPSPGGIVEKGSSVTSLEVEIVWVVTVEGWVVTGLGPSVSVMLSVSALFKISLSEEVAFLLSRLAQIGKEIPEDK